MPELIPKSAAVETVQLKPYYALEESPSLGYRVVEVIDATTDELNAQANPIYPLEKVPAKPSWADAGNEDVRYILAKAREELRRERASRPRPRPLEKTGWECLLYPFDVCWQILPLAFLLTFTLLILVKLSSGSDLPLPIIFLVLLGQIGITWSFLRQVLRLASAGERMRMPIAVFISDPAQLLIVR